MTLDAWREMVDRTRELERALGHPEKVVAAHEQETAILQRRCLRTARNLTEGTLLMRDAIEVLRPAPGDAILPHRIDQVVSRRLRRAMRRGEHFTWSVLE
ncbi:MAG: hypothetical protein HYY59_07645 [Candidatus Omnitrophica bacterium]|nr:hypothetical protein [Candidatus Omnitrophota bacterium]